MKLGVSFVHNRIFKSNENSLQHRMDIIIIELIIIVILRGLYYMPPESSNFWPHSLDHQSTVWVGVRGFVFRSMISIRELFCPGIKYNVQFNSIINLIHYLLITYVEMTYKVNTKHYKYTK